MNRRHAHRFASPALTGGEDLEDPRRLPCVKDRALRAKHEPSPFDVLMESVRGPRFEAAQYEAFLLCDACPIRQTCHRDQADEEWAQALAGYEPPAKAPGGPSNREIRAWAKANGHQVASTGKIPAPVVARYNLAHRSVA